MLKVSMNKRKGKRSFSYPSKPLLIIGKFESSYNQTSNIVVCIEHADSSPSELYKTRFLKDHEALLNLVIDSPVLKSFKETDSDLFTLDTRDVKEKAVVNC